MDQLKVLIAINGATLISVIVFGWKLIRFFARIEFKTDLMWEDYETRVSHSHRRASDK